MIALSYEGGVASPLDLSVPDPAKLLSRVAFPFSNDMALYTRYDELAQRSADEPYRKSDVAVIVGNGALLSMLPVLPEQIYLTDYSPEHLRWMNTLIKQVGEAPSLLDFMSWTGTLLRQARCQDAQDKEILSLGQYHHTTHQERYTNSRAKLLDTEVNFVDIDYTDLPSVQAFGTLLRESGSEIRVANFTNMMAHIVLGALDEVREAAEDYNNFRVGLNALPVAQHAQIFASDYGLRLPLPTSGSMQGYLTVAKKDIQMGFEGTLEKLEKTENKYQITTTGIQPKTV